MSVMSEKMKTNAAEHSRTKKPFLQVLNGEAPDRLPFWLMRQAGRYLPEYRAVREKAGGFLKMAFNPDLAAEVTLQPLRRFNMDAAILFSDILTIPLALGQPVEFVPGKGPVLDPVSPEDMLERLGMSAHFDETLSPVYEAVKQIRSGLKKEGFDQAALIGFAGAPWTVATYMVEGGSSKDFSKIKRWAYHDPASFSKLIDMLVEATSRYLCAQIDAGAEAVQIFDSWASALDAQGFYDWSIAPTARIVKNVKAAHPSTPVIGFPKGAGVLYPDYIEQTGIDAAGVDYQMPLTAIATTLQPLTVVQGNLDPMRLLAGGQDLDNAVESILDTLGDSPFIFNLGHGIQKETPPEHVARLSEIIRGFKPDWKTAEKIKFG